MPTWWSPALWEAARSGDYAIVLRLARQERGLSQEEFGSQVGFSASAISRFETGRRSLADVDVLRRFAEVLDLPAEAFGLRPVYRRPVAAMPMYQPSRVGHDHDHDHGSGGDDAVRRRAFLRAAGAAALAPGGLTGSGVEVDPAAFLAHRLENVLLGRSSFTPTTASLATLRSVLRTARTDFRACRYTDVAARLPELITSAHAAHDATDDPEMADALAHAHILATRSLIKLEASGLEWLAAERALRAAEQADNPLTLAESTRLLGAVCRRAGHHDRALTLTLGAADHLDVTSRAPDPQHLAHYGVLLCSAGYASARAGDAARATDLLNEADVTARRLTARRLTARRLTARRLTDRDACQALAANVLSHRVSAEHVLGNAGNALRHVHTGRHRTFPDTERHARFLVDVALCHSQAGTPDKAYQALLAAERIAPDEIRTRAAVRRLITELLQYRRRRELPDLHRLALRAGIS